MKLDTKSKLRKAKKNWTNRSVKLVFAFADKGKSIEYKSKAFFLFLKLTYWIAAIDKVLNAPPSQNKEKGGIITISKPQNNQKQ